LAPTQSSAQEDSARGPVPHRNVLSANPFLLIATWFNAEYERAVSNNASLGLRVSTINIGTDVDVDGDDDADYYSGRAFWRYYPTRAYTGFYFGLDLGITSLEESGDSHTVMGAGFELGYNWLLGARRNFYISIGAGADRLFGGELGDASAVIPTLRVVNIGWAF
ncbi:MAG: DUF3575 domain-containing protein, partial [Longimicrobiales bacterium]